MYLNATQEKGHYTGLCLCAVQSDMVENPILQLLSHYIISSNMLLSKHLLSSLYSIPLSMRNLSAMANLRALMDRKHTSLQCNTSATRRDLCVSELHSR